MKNYHYHLINFNYKSVNKTTYFGKYVLKGNNQITFKNHEVEETVTLLPYQYNKIKNELQAVHYKAYKSVFNLFKSLIHEPTLDTEPHYIIYTHNTWMYPVIQYLNNFFQYKINIKELIVSKEV